MVRASSVYMSADPLHSYDYHTVVEAMDHTGDSGIWQSINCTLGKWKEATASARSSTTIPSALGFAAGSNVKFGLNWSSKYHMIISLSTLPSPYESKVAGR